MSSDVVYQQTNLAYNLDGQVTLTTTYERFDDATGYGPLSSGNQALPSYVAAYYDRLGRLIGTVNVGTNGFPGFAMAYPPATFAANTRSNDTLVNSVTYNTAGQFAQQIDPRGLITSYQYDNLGRTTRVVQGNVLVGCANTFNIVGGVTLQITTNLYDGNNHLVTTAQTSPPRNGIANNTTTTQYIYQARVNPVPGALASSVNSNDLLTQVTTTVSNPDWSSENRSGSVYYGVNAAGQNLSFKDQNGTLRVYLHDDLGRQKVDLISAFAVGLNQLVDLMTTSYNVQGG